MNRMLSHLKDHNVELVGSERPRHSLVLKADFPELEARKALAASALIREQGRQYEHEKSLQEKRAEWEMQRQDAAEAKEAAWRSFNLRHSV